MTQPATDDDITVHQAIIEAITSLDNPSSTHSQRCPIWTQRAKHPPITDCNCWRLEQLTRMADVICARLDGDT